MGLTWMTEIISWASGGPDYYWYATDAINLLRAVFIFIIFCCKRKVWNAGQPPIVHYSIRFEIESLSRERRAGSVLLWSIIRESVFLAGVPPDHGPRVGGR